MEYFHFQNQRIAYVQKGCGNPILFLHNGGTSHAIWQSQLDALSSQFHVYALDLPGYGQSSPPDSGYSLAAYTDLLDAFIIANIQSPQITLVGNCMGSAIALNYAKSNPVKLHALVLINPLTEATFRGGHLGPLLYLKKHAPDLSRLLSAGIAKLPVPMFAITPGIMLQMGKHGRKQRLWRNPGLRNSYKNPNAMAALTGLFNHIPQFSILDQFKPGQNFPSLYTVWGKQNRVLSEASGQILNSSLRPKNTLTLDDCGHLLMLERPQEVTRFIQEACRAV